MKDFRNNEKLVVFLGPVTGKEFQDRYIDMSMSKDKLPVASTIIPIQNKGEEAQPLFFAWIFYEKPGEQQPAALKNAEVKKLDL